ncbi:SigE family RNA polymerase sigma factor [Catenulispora pinisilvae]|uniref:SigE family RNA polymerase sigma factor n=1 Tax=Catenulispora pinisilvae TaxID=2705253 RepID=UPI001891D767|nr:SigE family RNA polymerase sigma factor [Catenulispora pinisilvae]
MRGDDTDGYDVEFREYMVSRWGGLVRFAYGLTGDRGHAEDLAQTALAKAYASWSRVRRAEDPDAYVRRILINANHRRFRKRRVEERTGDVPVDVLQGLTIADDTGAFDEREALMSALMELPPKQRAVVVLRYWDGLTETQAATVLGCSVGTVKSQASRALAKLRASAQLQDGSVTL